MLEFSENLIDCDAIDDDDDDSEDNSTIINTPSPHVPVIEQATRKVNLPRPEIIDSISSSEASRNGTASLYTRMKQQQAEQKQQKSDQSETMTRTSDHVSCEDLLEFACDGPNSRRTRGPRNGEQSDEVS